MTRDIPSATPDATALLLKLQADPEYAVFNRQEVLDEITAAKKIATREDISPEEIEAYEKLWREYYNMLLLMECVVGDGDVSPALLAKVTQREVAAGRMSLDDDLRTLAMIGEQFVENRREVERRPLRALQPSSKDHNRSVAFGDACSACEMAKIQRSAGKVSGLVADTFATAKKSSRLSTQWSGFWAARSWSLSWGCA